MTAALLRHARIPATQEPVFPRKTQLRLLAEARAAQPHLPGGHDDVANAAAGALVTAAEGPPSQPHDPRDDEPFDAWSPEALRAEWERGHRVKRHWPERGPAPDAAW